MCFICRPPGQRTLSGDFVINFKQNLLVFLFKKRSDDRYLAHCEIKSLFTEKLLEEVDYRAEWSGDNPEKDLEEAVLFLNRYGEIG